MANRRPHMADRQLSSSIHIAACLLLALNLRPALATVGPLLDDIERSARLTHSEAGLLTTLPVLAMGLCALLVRPLRTAFGEQPGIGLGMALIAAACAARAVWTGKTGLLGTALAAGIGIALVQALLPSFIKRRFGPQAGRIMGLYTTGIMAGAAFAAASAAAIAAALDWAFALAVWALPASVGLIAWSVLTWHERDATSAIPKAPTLVLNPPSLWLNGRAWLLLIFFGIGTGAYTLVLAWLPPYYTGLGWRAGDAGLLLGAITLAQVVAGLAVSASVGRFPDRRGPLLAALALLFAGLLCLFAASLALALPASLLLGLGIGALFPLSLIVALDHVDEPERAGDLTAFVQGGGYVIASAMPFLAGLMRDRFADLAQAWAFMATGVALLALICLRFSPASYSHLSR